nr:type III pantothenate kinase [Bacilli bacterium]
MLLVIDIGNTNVVLGIYEGDTLRHHWRIQTVRERTADEWWIQVKALFVDAGVVANLIGGIAVSSVVPPVTPAIMAMVDRHFQAPHFLVTPESITDMPIDYDPPREVGADRIVNAVAGIAEYEPPLIIIDFGTATTFCVIDDSGRYKGGLIVPGIQISAEALFQRAAKLPRIELRRPEHVVGRNTVEAMQAGVIFGYTGLIEGIVARIKQENPLPYRVLATGGFAAVLGAETKVIDIIDAHLTLKGLRILWEKNGQKERSS